MLSVHQEWDPLKVCVVGKNYPPEFYSFMKNSKMRNLFEKIARETEEDYQSLIKILESFNVEVLRPNVPDVVPQEYIDQNLPIPAPVSAIPRDQMIMIGDTFFLFPYFRTNQKINWMSGEEHLVKNFDVCWEGILDYVASKGNKVVNNQNDEDLAWIKVNGIFRIGKDLFFGTKQKMTDWRVLDAIDIMKNTWLQDYNTHAVTTEGHIDGVFNPLKPGLIFSAFDADTYEETFPNWEVVYFEQNRMNSMGEWMFLKKKNHGKWFIPGVADDDEIIEYVEHWLKDWLGYVEETIFDVNVLMIDPKNVILGSYNEKAFKALERHGITPHIAPMRHRFFWDGGAHCVTAELHREGIRQTFF
jgi:N-dimethylarginine dimethylaminohydrolase